MREWTFLEPASMRIYAVINFLCFVLVFNAVGYAVADDLKNTALISVKDLPNFRGDLFRYVSRNDETFGPSAFIDKARRLGITRLELSEGGEVAVDCAKELGAKLAIPVVVASKAERRKLEPIDVPLHLDACRIATNIPKPDLGDGQIYVRYSYLGPHFVDESPLSHPELKKNLLPGALRQWCCVIPQS